MIERPAAGLNDKNNIKWSIWSARFYLTLLFKHLQKTTAKMDSAQPSTSSASSATPVASTSTSAVTPTFRGELYYLVSILLDDFLRHCRCGQFS